MSKAVHNVQLSDAAYLAYESRAKSAGLTVTEYLNRGGADGVEPDGFRLTAEIKEGIEQGVAQSARGETVSLEESKANSSASGK